jgi:hypothetical protein
MTGLLLYVLVVSLMLGAAAALAEPVLRAMGLPTRWAWGAAMAGSVALGAWALVGPAPTPSTTVPASAELVTTLGSQAPAPTVGPVGGWVAASASLAARLPRTVDRSLARVAHLLPELTGAAAPLLALGWVSASVLLLARLLGGAFRHARIRRGWPLVRVAGETARLSPGLAPADGPAVAGLTRPEIILPRWALELPDSELRLVLRHEAEHRAACDPQLLAGAALLVSLCPWNPVLWWQLRRLRDAVELDCDARVLRTEGTRRPYAELLLRVGARKPAPSLSATGVASPFPFAFPAIRGSTSQLERRLRAMRPFRVRPLPLAAATSAALLLAVSACMSDRPTPVEVEPPSAPAAVMERIEVPPAPPSVGEATFEVTELRRAPDANHLELEVGPLERRSDGSGIEEIRLEETPAPGGTPTVLLRNSVNADPAGEPLYVVDGVIVSSGDLGCPAARPGLEPPVLRSAVHPPSRRAPPRPSRQPPPRSDFGSRASREHRVLIASVPFRGPLDGDRRAPAAGDRGQGLCCSGCSPPRSAWCCSCSPVCSSACC